MKSTSTGSTLKGMDSVKMYLARNSSYDENKQPYHIGSVAPRVNMDRAFHQHRGVKYATGASMKIRKRGITMGTWTTMSRGVAGKLQAELSHEMDRYKWNILGLCEMRW